MGVFVVKAVKSEQIVGWQTGVKRPRVKEVFWRGKSKSEAEIFCELFTQIGNVKLVAQLLDGMAAAQRNQRLK